MESGAERNLISDKDKHANENPNLRQSVCICYERNAGRLAIIISLLTASTLRNRPLWRLFLPQQCLQTLNNWASSSQYCLVSNHCDERIAK